MLFKKQVQWSMYVRYIALPGKAFEQIRATLFAHVNPA